MYFLAYWINRKVIVLIKGPSHSTRPLSKLLRLAEIHNIVWVAASWRAHNGKCIIITMDLLDELFPVINDLLAITYQCCRDLERSCCKLYTNTCQLLRVCEDCLRVLNDWETISVRLYCNRRYILARDLQGNLLYDCSKLATPLQEGCWGVASPWHNDFHRKAY